MSKIKIKPTTRRTVKKVATPAPPATFKLETTDLKLISILQDAIKAHNLSEDAKSSADFFAKISNGTMSDKGIYEPRDIKKEGAQSVNPIPNINKEYIDKIVEGYKLEKKSNIPNKYIDAFLFTNEARQKDVEKEMERLGINEQKAVEQETDRPTPGPEIAVGVIQKLVDIDTAIDNQSDTLNALLTTISIITGKRPQETTVREEPVYTSLQSKLAQVEYRIGEIANTIREANYQLKAELEG